jgi:protein gp37
VPGGAYEGLTTVRRGRLDWLGVSRPVPEMLDRPLHWRDPRCVFVESMGDLWHPGIPFEFVAAVFGVMAACPQHRFIILTKQARRMREWFEWIECHPQDVEGVLLGKRWPLSNVALLVSAWDQGSAERYVPYLHACPAAVRGVSAEPLLGPMDLLYAAFNGADSLSGMAGIDWVICGGESGAKARTMQPAWARSLRDQCVSAGVPFFFKQWGNWAPTYDDFYSEDLDAWIKGERLVRHRTKAGGGRELDGRTWDEFPKAWT